MPTCCSTPGPAWACPVWDGATKRLRWVDINPGVVHELDVESGEDRATEIGPTVGAVALRASGGLVVARSTGCPCCAEDGTVTEAVVFEGEAGRDGHRMNDGQCDPAGRFWTGSIVMDKTGPNGALYRVDADLSTEVVRTGVSMSNGLGWSPDATTMYFMDGRLRGRRRLPLRPRQR